MPAKFLIRFDDICPTMNWECFEYIEMLLDYHNIKPILAVVPDNVDSKLIVGEPVPDFWDRVRAWQAKGWCIAIHGYQHRYESLDAGLMGLNTYSEFAGLSEKIQRQKLDSGLRIFSEQGVNPGVWIAPAHSFDKLTVSLLVEKGIDIISDGFYLKPVRWLDVLWLPQQLWKFERLPFGLWTVCYHHNGFSSDSLEAFKKDINKFASSIISVDEVEVFFEAKDRSWLDVSFSRFWMLRIQFKKILKKMLDKLL